MNILKGATEDVTAAGVTLTNNAIAKLQETLTALAAQVTPEGEQLLEAARAQATLLLTTIEQDAEKLLEKGENEGRELIDHARDELLKLEFYFSCGFREKQPPPPTT